MREKRTFMKMGGQDSALMRSNGGAQGDNGAMTADERIVNEGRPTLFFSTSSYSTVHLKGHCHEIFDFRIFS